MSSTGTPVRAQSVDLLYDSKYFGVRSTHFPKIHNSLLNDIANMEGDFNDLAAMFNDSTWSYENMRKYFIRIENNLYLNKSDPDHGFDGWMKTSLNPLSILSNPQFAGRDRYWHGSNANLTLVGPRSSVG